MPVLLPLFKGTLVSAPLLSKRFLLVDILQCHLYLMVLIHLVCDHFSCLPPALTSALFTVMNVLSALIYCMTNHVYLFFHLYHILSCQLLLLVAAPRVAT